MKCTINRPQITGKFPFNKKNAAWFADQIYSENKDEVQFAKLCCGILEDKKSRKLHCAIGEAYAIFVKPSLREILKHDKTGSYQGKWSSDGNSTGAAIDALVEKAELKNNTDEGRYDLASALSDCVGSNDDDSNYYGDGPLVAEYIIRAKQVADTWRQEVLPLLK